MGRGSRGPVCATAYEYGSPAQCATAAPAFSRGAPQPAACLCLFVHMFAGIPTALSKSSAMEARNLGIQTWDPVIERLSTSTIEALYEQHHLHRRLDCHCSRSLVIFWLALGSVRAIAHAAHLLGRMDGERMGRVARPRRDAAGHFARQRLLAARGAVRCIDSDVMGSGGARQDPAFRIRRKVPARVRARRLMPAHRAARFGAAFFRSRAARFSGVSAPWHASHSWLPRAPAPRSSAAPARPGCAPSAPR